MEDSLLSIKSLPIHLLWGSSTVIQSRVQLVKYEERSWWQPASADRVMMVDGHLKKQKGSENKQKGNGWICMTCLRPRDLLDHALSVVADIYICIFIISRLYAYNSDWVMHASMTMRF